MSNISVTSGSLRWRITILILIGTRIKENIPQQQQQAMN